MVPPAFPPRVWWPTSQTCLSGPPDSTGSEALSRSSEASQPQDGPEDQAGESLEVLLKRTVLVGHRA